MLSQVEGVQGTLVQLWPISPGYLLVTAQALVEGLGWVRKVGDVDYAANLFAPGANLAGLTCNLGPRASLPPLLPFHLSVF